MFISHLSLVNQKLAHTGALVKLLNEPKPRQKLEQQALLDAALFQLHLGLYFYLRELAEYHRIKNLSEIQSIEDLLFAIQGANRVSCEVSELVSLSREKESWLSQILQSYSQLFTSPDTPKEKKAFGRENLIELVELNESEDMQAIILSPDRLSSWLDAFKALVIRHRDTCAEY